MARYGNTNLYNNLIMGKLVNKTVPTTLVGVNGNAFSLMAHFKLQAARAGWDSEEIEIVISEAISGDYNHLVATLASYCEED